MIVRIIAIHPKNAQRIVLIHIIASGFTLPVNAAHWSSKEKFIFFCKINKINYTSIKISKLPLISSINYIICSFLYFNDVYFFFSYTRITWKNLSICYNDTGFISSWIIMIKEFMAFLSQYNIFGIAIWLLIATKVWTLIKWLIEDLITPLILQPILTKLRVKHIEDLSYKWILYGKVISTLIDFLITAFLVFLIVKYAGVTLQTK